MDYIYDEISDKDRSLFLAHLSQCQACQKELAALKQTSNILQRWEDVDPDFNVVMLMEKVSWFSKMKGALASLFPTPKRFVYGFATVIVGVFLLLAIANTEISYRKGEFKMSLGLFSKPPAKTTVDDALTQQLIQKLQQENFYLTSSLIQQSEARQRKELASNILKLKQDFEHQRVEDLNMVGFGLDNIEKNTFRKIESTDKSLNEIIRLINAQSK
jgi:hypothetical protein